MRTHDHKQQSAVPTGANGATRAPYWLNRLARPDETSPILELVHAVHGDGRVEINDAYWRWRYLNDTDYRADIIMSDFEGRPIGIQPMAIFDWQWGGQRLKGAMYTGVLTHPDHRRRGIFRTLIDSSNEHAARRGAQFSMTLPNELSLPGFLRFGEWHYPGLIPLMIKVIDGGAALRPRLGGIVAGLFGWLPRAFFRRSRGVVGDDLDCELVERAPADLDDVFDRFVIDCNRLMIRRTAGYWNWRYCTRPGASYRTMIARRHGQTVGAICTSIGRRFGMDIGMIMDVMTADGVPTLRRLIQRAEEDVLGRGLGLITCQATSPRLQEALFAEGYRLPPPRRLPKKFHFVYRPTGVSGLPQAPGVISDWHLTFGDSDNA